MSNRSDGIHFEGELCEILFKHDFWAHNIAQNRDGQPADVIAVRGDKAYLIDCKNCFHDRFHLSRIEFNQESSMELWEDCGNTECYFALKDSLGKIYMAHFDQLIAFRDYEERKIINDLSIFQPLEDWLCEQKSGM